MRPYPIRLAHIDGEHRDINIRSSEIEATQGGKKRHQLERQLLKIGLRTFNWL